MEEMILSINIYGLANDIDKNYNIFLISYSFISGHDFALRYFHHLLH